MSNIIERLKEPLDIRDVDFRIHSINKSGYATILAYKDARVDMNRLDEVCGVNWQDDYKLIDGQLFCGIAIKIEDEWIWRWDVGAESFTEKVKGRASDAFKRAGFRWGIGRELYDYPTIQVKLNQNEFKVENERARQTWNLKLKEWVWSAEFKDGKIRSLTAKDNNGKARFNYSKTTPIKQSTQTKAKEWVRKKLEILDENKDMTKDFIAVTDRINKGVFQNIEDIEKYYILTENLKSKLTEIFNYKTA